MTIVHHEVERLDVRIGRIPSMHGLAFVADDHVLDHAPHDVIEDRYAEEREAVGPGDEDGADGDQRDPGRAIEVLVEVELVVPARRTVRDDRAGSRRDDVGRLAAAVARLRGFAGRATESGLSLSAEKVNAGHPAPRLTPKA